MFTACNNNNIDRILDTAENIADSRPDSALMLLNPIVDPLSLTKDQYARHAIISLYAKHLTNENMPADTSMIYTKKYLKRNNFKCIVLRELYLGNVYLKQKEYDKALESYVTAEAAAIQLKDDDLIGRIHYHTGEILYHQRFYDKAINRFNLSLEYLNKSSHNYKRIISVYNILGNSFLIKKTKDKAMEYYNKALELAETNTDYTCLAIVKQNLAMVYTVLNQPNTAKQHLLQALELHSDIQDKIYLSLGKMYEQKGDKDSAIYYAKLVVKLLEMKKDTSALVSNYRLLSNLEESRGNHEKAIQYSNQYKSCLLKIEKENYQYKIQEAEKKHEQKSFEYKLSMKQKYKFAILSFVIVLSFVVSFSLRKISLQKTSLRKKDTETSKLQDELAETTRLSNEKSIELSETQKNWDETGKTLTETKKQLNEKKEKLAETEAELNKNKGELLKAERIATNIQNKLSETEKRKTIYSDLLEKTYKYIADKIYDLTVRIEINEKTAESEDSVKYLKEFEQNLKSILSKNDTEWKIIKTIFKSSFDKISSKYPKLTTPEFKIACLVYVGFDNRLISFILNLETSSISHHCTSIRAKMKIEPGGNIQEFITRFLIKDAEKE
jgi:hypothetical protein